MPNLTVTHEAPLELIRQHPALAVDLLRAFTGLTVSDQADIIPAGICGRSSSTRITLPPRTGLALT
jgi:hypothetical protein